jgi:hypothetical protein
MVKYKSIYLKLLNLRIAPLNERTSYISPRGLLDLPPRGDSGCLDPRSSLSAQSDERSWIIRR